MSAEEKLLENGYEDVVYFTDYGYDDALVGGNNESICCMV